MEAFDRLQLVNTDCSIVLEIGDNLLFEQRAHVYVARQRVSQRLSDDRLRACRAGAIATEQPIANLMAHKVMWVQGSRRQ